MKSKSYQAWTMAAAVAVMGSTLLAGCASKSDPIVQAAKVDAAKGIAAPSLEQTKAIAEEGFIYGLPLVMNYAVMNEFAVDTKSSQFKAPFNKLHNDHHVATPADTAVITPNSDTPYSILWADLRAEPLVITVPAVSRKRYYSVQLISPTLKPGPALEKRIKRALATISE